MRLLILAMVILYVAFLGGCADDPDAFYICFGGVKVKDLAECSFDNMDFTPDNCEKVLVYETATIVTDADDVIPAFRMYKSSQLQNLTYVSSEYLKMYNGMDFYRINFFDNDMEQRKQYFIDQYGNVYAPKNCKEKEK